MPQATHQPLHSAAFKAAMRRHVGGVTVVALWGPNGEYAGITATAVTALSAEPPAILVCVNQSSRLAPFLTEGTIFSVNLLSADQDGVARTFGGMTQAQGDARFLHGNWHRSASGCPILLGARASLECRALEILPRFSHLIVVGSVISATFAEAVAPALASDQGLMVPVDTHHTARVA